MVVIYTDEVYADNEEDAIRQVIESCPYDNDDSVEPYVKTIKESDTDAEEFKK